MVDGKRTYSSPLRAEQARRTRTAVVDAAERCFLAQGYAATTMRDIAAAAGVSVQTVAAQGPKSALLLRCVDRSLTGDDADEPLLARDPFVALLDEGASRRQKLSALREIAADADPRMAPMVRVFAAAAAADPEIAASWSHYAQLRHQDMHAIVGAFERWLRKDLDLDRATDIAWAVFSHETSAALVEERGWSPEDFADWLVDSFERLLLTRR